MPHDAPSISVIMSTYNRKQFLQRSVESVLSQTFQGFEFVLVDNGSTDGSREICERYAQMDLRVKLIRIAENRGAPIGRNAGLESASADFVTFVDDDDYCEPEMLEFLWYLAKEYQADISMCGSWNEFPDRREPYFIYDELLVLGKVDALHELLKRQKFNVAPPTKLFRKSLFEGIRFKKNVLVDDIHVIYKVFAAANRVVAQGKPLYRFRKHDHNMTVFIHQNRLNANIIMEYLAAFRERTIYLSEKIPEIALRARYSEWSYMISMCKKIQDMNTPDLLSVYDWMIGQLKTDRQEILACPYTTEGEISFMKHHVP